MYRKTLGALFLSFAASPAVFSQTFVCPTGPGPGQRQVGMTGGSPGLASVPVCEQFSTGPAAAAPRAEPSPADALGGLARGQLELLREGQELIKEGQRIAQDPQYQKLRKGYWMFSRDEKNPRSGLECVAIFGSMSGAVQLSGPTAKHNGALLTFLGMNIPQPSSPRKIRTILTQNNEQPQDVGAINYTMSDGKWGAIVYALGGSDALIKELGEEEEARFKVSVEGKEVISTFYKEGSKARDFLRQCMAGQPTK